MSVNNVSPGLRKRLAGAQDGFCPECGYALPGDLSETEVDHIIPRARGGPNVPWNKRLVHFRCNRRKRFKLTPEAEALAKEHGVVLHMPIPASAHAYRPLTRAKSLHEDYMHALFNGSAEEREHAIRQYLDECKRES